MDGVALSVNVNKIALLRNSRGRNTPDLLGLIDLCLASGADGITIHPRRESMKGGRSRSSSGDQRNLKP